MFNRMLVVAGLTAVVATPGIAMAEDAAPAAAPAAAAGTPLSKMLDASGITVSAFSRSAFVPPRSNATVVSPFVPNVVSSEPSVFSR